MVQVSEAHQCLSGAPKTELLDTLILARLMRGSQEEYATASIHHYNRKGPRVDLTWNSLLDLTTMIEGQTCGWSRSEAHQCLSGAQKTELLDTLKILARLVRGSQEEYATVSIHHYSGERPRVGLTWSSLLDLSSG